MNHVSPPPTGDIDELYEDVTAILRPKRNADLIAFAKEHMPSWDADLAHMLHAPMRDLTRREFKSVVFVGAARTGKTYSLVTIFLGYTVMSDPVDMAIFMPTELLAGYYSKKRWGVEMMTDIPTLSNQIRSGSGNSTVYTKILKSGAIINFGWNSVNQVASKDFVRVVLSDIDRAGDTGSEGSFWELASKRTTTAMSRGMALAESSPGKPISDPEYVQTSLHEAPPTTGILGIYNQGNRQIAYSQCPHCNEYFSPIPDIAAFHINPELPRRERAKAAFMVCTVCGGEVHHTYEKEFKRKAVWVGEGQTVTSEGVVEGELLATDTASYWQSGWFAAFVSWEGLIIQWIDAYGEFEATGDEARLRAVYNTGFAAPYLEHARRVDTSRVGILQARAEPLERYFVPEWGRVLLASVDIQGGRNSRFVVQVHAYGAHGERCVVDRFSITQRDDGSRVSPHSNIEDWELITHKVVNATYRISDDKEMRVYRTAIDMGGSAGVSERAYFYWRTLKKQRLSSRVQLVKGGSATSMIAPIAKISYPDATNKADRFSGGRGDVPLAVLNTLLLKDAIKASIDREEPGPNYFHMSDWLTEPWYKEIVSEVRTEKAWIQVGRKNEAWDLCCYAHALWFLLKGPQVNWDAPPSWCAPTDGDLNSEVMTTEDRRELKAKPLKKVSRNVRFRFGN